jgi:hypothetical protein
MACQSTYYALSGLKNETSSQHDSERKTIADHQNKNFILMQIKTRTAMFIRRILIKNPYFQPNMALPLLSLTAIFATLLTLPGKNDPKTII